jgi:hypothetical protein
MAENTNNEIENKASTRDNVFENNAPKLEDASPVAAAPPSAAVTLTFRGLTIPRRGQEPMLVADMTMAGMSRAEVVLFTEGLEKLPDWVRMVARVPAAGSGGTVLVPVVLKRGTRSVLGNIEIVSADYEQRPMSRLLPEFIRDGVGRRWMRPISAVSPSAPRTHSKLHRPLSKAARSRPR